MNVLFALLIALGIVILYISIYFMAYERALKGIYQNIDLGAPKKELHEVITGDVRYEYERIYKFIKGEYISYRDIDMNWMSNFISVCHWAGYQIILHKEGKQDIESPDSVVFDSELLNEFRKEHRTFDKKTFETFKERKTRHEKELQHIKEKLNY